MLLWRFVFVIVSVLEFIVTFQAMSFDDAAGLLRQTTREAFIGLPDVSLGSPNIERRGSAFGCNIPMLTEIGTYSNPIRQYLCRIACGKSKLN